MSHPLRTVEAAAAALAAVLSATGCVMPDQLARIQKDVADVRQQMAQLQKEQAAVGQKLAGVEAQMGGQDAIKRSDFADLKVRVDDLSRQSTSLDEHLKETNRRIDRISQDVQANRELTRRYGAAPSTSEGGSAPPAAAGAVAGAATDAVPSPEALYNTAYADFSKGNYALAIAGFKEYQSRYPESDLADNALYWIGECLFSQGKFGDAVQAFDRMLEKYPQSDRAAAANLKKGLAFLEQNQVSQAIVQLRYVTATYPASDEARIARDKLASLGAPAGR